MKSYDGLNSSYGTHTIKVSLQDDEYKGSFTYKIGGNCKGISVLSFDVSCEHEKQIAKWKKTDCAIELDYEGNLIVTLTNPQTKETCRYELDDDEFMRMIVGVEIIEFQSE